MPFAQDSVMDVRSAARTPSGPPICAPHMHMSDTGSASEPAYLAVGHLAIAIAAHDLRAGPPICALRTSRAPSRTHAGRLRM